MRPTDWRDDSGPPRVPRRLLRWYRQRVAQWFHESQKKQPIDVALCAGLVVWFSARPEFLRWQVYDKYQGARYASGYWEIDFAAMHPALNTAIREVEEDERRQAYSALGPITPADVERALAVLHGPGPLQQESFAGHLYADHNAAMAYYENRNNIQDLGIRVCKQCGDSFKPTVRKRQTCPECLAAARLKRQRAGGQEGAQ